MRTQLPTSSCSLRILPHTCCCINLVHACSVNPATHVRFPSPAKHVPSSSLAVLGASKSFTACPPRPPRDQRLSKHGTDPSDLLSLLYTCLAVGLVVVATLLRRGMGVILLSMLLYDICLGERLHLLSSFHEGLVDLAAKLTAVMVWGGHHIGWPTAAWPSAIGRPRASTGRPAVVHVCCGAVWPCY